MASRSDHLQITPGSSHWGAFNAVVENGRLIEAQPFAHDPDPSPILRSIPDAVHHHSRVAKPVGSRGLAEARARAPRMMDVVVIDLSRCHGSARSI